MAMSNTSYAVIATSRVRMLATSPLRLGTTEGYFWLVYQIFLLS
jgi:hypothetical protein